MKILRNATIAAAALVATATAANAQGWYVGAAAGLTIANVNSATINGSTERLKFEMGPVLAASVGYKWGGSIPLRTEFEFSYADNTAKSDGSGNPLAGKRRDLSALVNFMFDVNTGSKFIPYVGAGVGFTRLITDDFRGVGSPTAFDSSSTKLGWQAILGVAYAVTDNSRISLDYRIKGSGSHSFTGNLVAIGSTTRATLTDYKPRGHRLMVGYSSNF